MAWWQRRPPEHCCNSLASLRGARCVADHTKPTVRDEWGKRQPAGRKTLSLWSLLINSGEEEAKNKEHVYIYASLEEWCPRFYNDTSLRGLGTPTPSEPPGVQPCSGAAPSISQVHRMSLREQEEKKNNTYHYYCANHAEQQKKKQTNRSRRRAGKSRKELYTILYYHIINNMIRARRYEGSVSFVILSEVASAIYIQTTCSISREQRLGSFSEFSEF